MSLLLYALGKPCLGVLLGGFFFAAPVHDVGALPAVEAEAGFDVEIEDLQEEVEDLRVPEQVPVPDPDPVPPRKDKAPRPQKTPRD